MAPVVGFLANPAGIEAAATVFLGILTGGLLWIASDQARTTRRQLRAYVLAESAGMGDGVSPGPWCRIVIKNSGSTPAYDVEHWCALAYCTQGSEKELRAPAKLARQLENILGPGGTSSADRPLGRELTADELDTLAKGGSILCVYGKITYRDEFGRKRSTEYKLGYAGKWPPDPGVNLSHVPGGNRVR